MRDPDTPRSLGTVKELVLTGMLIPWVKRGRLGEPVLLRFPGDDNDYIPIWTRETDLRTFMEQVGCQFDSIKLIEDGREWLMNVAENHYRVAVNLWFTAEGRQRFHMVDPRHPIKETELQ